MGQMPYYVNGHPTHCQRPECSKEFTNTCFCSETPQRTTRYYCDEACAEADLNRVPIAKEKLQ